MMDPVLAPLTELLRKNRFRKPSLPYVSNVTGRWITDREATDPAYWAGHVRQTVRFADGVGELLKDPESILLEVGPGQTLSSLAGQHAAKAAGHQVVSSFSSSIEQEACDLPSALGRLWLAGVPVDWSGFYQNEKRRRVALPTYPFERKRFWVEPARPVVPPTADNAPASSRADSTFSSTGATDLSPSHAPASDTHAADSTLSRKKRLLAMLTTQFQEMSGANLEDVGPSATFMEMGLDSLFLGVARSAVEKRFGVKITFRQLLEEITTLNDLADFLDKNLPPAAFPAILSQAPALSSGESAPASGDSALETIQAQLQALTRELERLRQAAPGSSPTVSPAAPLTDVPGAVETEPAQVLTLPLSEAQMELWLAAETAQEASCAFNQAFSIHLRGSLDVEALRQTLQELVDRHDALRTTFLPDGSGQQIYPARKLDVPLRDFSPLTPAERERNLAETLALEDRTAFDLENGPLFRALIIKLSETHHVVVVAAHHLVLDGWSISILLRELSLLYTARSQRAPDGLEPAMQYRDYLRWLGTPENRARSAEAEAYWLRQFVNPPDTPELPVDRPRPAAKTYRAASRSLTVDPAAYHLLKQAAAAQGCTLFTYMLASLKVWLHRLTGQADLVIGIHAAGQVAVDSQKNQGSRSLVGHCVSLLPVRSYCDGDKPFTDYLHDVKRQVLDAYEHQNHTFGSLVKKLNLPRDASRVPLIPLTFNLSRVAHSLRLADSEVVFPPKNFNFFDLNIEAADSGRDLRIHCRFNADLFDGDTISRMLGHFQTLLKGIVADPSQRILDLPLLTQGERHQILVEGNQTGRDFSRDKCVYQWFEEQARATPQAVAVVFEGQELSYGQLNRRANQLARRLEKLGVGPDQVVAVCLERSLDLIVCLLAILKAGGAYLPVDPALPRDRQQLMLDDARPTALITEQKLQAGLPPVTAPVVIFDRERAGLESEPGDDVPRARDGKKNRGLRDLYLGLDRLAQGRRNPARGADQFFGLDAKEPGLTARDVFGRDHVFLRHRGPGNLFAAGQRRARGGAERRRCRRRLPHRAPLANAPARRSCRRPRRRGACCSTCNGRATRT